MRKTISILFICFFALAGCERYEPAEAFLNNDGICFTEGGTIIMEYDPLTWQMAFNSTKRQFRAFDDTMKNKYTVTLSRIPEKTEQMITCNVSWTADGRIKNEMKMDFKVWQTDGKGTWWLWNMSKKRIGMTIRIPDDM